ncbi:hypothetical protein D3C80_268230 [compost metagenome]
MGYIQESTRASAILNFWYGLALQGYPGTTMDERVEADRLRLHALIYKMRGLTSWQRLTSAGRRRCSGGC